ncbi:MAG: hypothetical protein K2K41_07360 [Ruminiclostridium sp.]|nr:hypothetical protein [Ruminiclostridium sp.]
MPLIENEDNYYYDFYGLEDRISSIGTHVSEVHEDVRIVETQISELVSVQSEQFSELMSAHSEQVSEIVSVMIDNAVYTADTVHSIDTVIVLLFVVIALVGAVCGFMIVNLIRK